MPKPWAKYEVGFIDHDKFRVLPATAICLWLEGKNYADGKHTDGLLPTYIVKGFRFYTKKSVDMLMASAGPKTATDAYAPLWESHDLGWKMHDYLDHNDCRDEVLQRIEDAVDKEELRRLKAKDRMRATRAERRHQLDLRRAGEANSSQPVRSFVREPSANIANSSRTVHPLTETATETATETDPPARQEEERPPSARSRRPMFTGQRLTVFEWMVDELCRLLGPHVDAFHLDEWFFALDAQCLLNHIIPPDRDNGAWLKKQCLLEAQRRGLPLRVASATESDAVRLAAYEWLCPHEPECLGRHACHIRQQLEDAKKGQPV